MYIQEVGSGLQSPAVVLSQQGSPGGGRVVPAGCVSILQWGEFLLPRYFKGNEVPGGEEFITLHPSQLLHSGQARVGQSSLNGSLFHEYGGLGGPHRHGKHLCFPEMLRILKLSNSHLPHVQR